MEKLAEVCRASEGLSLATPYKQVDVTYTTNVEEATRWWEELTSRGGEGKVVKPLEFVVRGRRGLTQPPPESRRKKKQLLVVDRSFDIRTYQEITELPKILQN
jgi:PNKP adenylyltransferase domain, ligase domain